MSDEIEIEVWFRPGNGMMYRTDYLPISHEKHPYNQILSRGLIPEDYGYYHPAYEQYKDYTKNQLIHEVCELKREINALYAAEAAGFLRNK